MLIRLKCLIKLASLLSMEVDLKVVANSHIYIYIYIYMVLFLSMEKFARKTNLNNFLEYLNIGMNFLDHSSFNE